MCILIMIPKTANAITHSDFRPISLCNRLALLFSSIIHNKIFEFLNKK